MPVLATGFHRCIYLCKLCGKVQAHDFIPKSIGVGAWYGTCLCNAVEGSNWFKDAILLRTIERHNKS